MTELSDEELRFLTGIFDLARHGQAVELADLIDRGVPVNLTAANGDTLLILAAYHQHLASVTALLQRGADPNRINDRGQTALGAAVFRRAADIATVLLAAGADPEAGGRSARDIARFFSLAEMTALLDAEAARPPT